MSLSIRQRKALASLRNDMTLQRAPMPPIYDSGFARKAKFFFIAVSGSAAFVGLAAATAYCCITFGI